MVIYPNAIVDHHFDELDSFQFCAVCCPCDIMLSKFFQSCALHTATSQIDQQNESK